MVEPVIRTSEDGDVGHGRSVAAAKLAELLKKWLFSSHCLLEMCFSCLIPFINVDP